MKGRKMTQCHIHVVTLLSLHFTLSCIMPHASAAPAISGHKRSYLLLRQDMFLFHSLLQWIHVTFGLQRPTICIVSFSDFNLLSSTFSSLLGIFLMFRGASRRCMYACPLGITIYRRQISCQITLFLFLTSLKNLVQHGLDQSLWVARCKHLHLGSSNCSS